MNKMHFLQTLKHAGKEKEGGGGGGGGGGAGWQQVQLTGFFPHRGGGRLRTVDSARRRLPGAASGYSETLDPSPPSMSKSASTQCSSIVRTRVGVGILRRSTR